LFTPLAWVRAGAEVCGFPSARINDNHEFMKKSISDNQKKTRRGRPKTTGTTPMTGVRLSLNLESEIAIWARAQVDKPNKAEAIRRLIVMGLEAAKKKR
jgi:hypothetical protein